MGVTDACFSAASAARAATTIDMLGGPDSEGRIDFDAFLARPRALDLIAERDGGEWSQGVNASAIVRPDGRPLRLSPTLPGRTDDPRRSTTRIGPIVEAIHTQGLGAHHESDRR